MRTSLIKQKRLKVVTIQLFPLWTLNTANADVARKSFAAYCRAQGNTQQLADLPLRIAKLVAVACYCSCVTFLALLECSNDDDQS